MLRLCTGSLRKMCLINQIISEKAIFNFTGYKWHASVLYGLHWMLNAGTNDIHDIGERFFATMRLNLACKGTPDSWPLFFPLPLWHTKTRKTAVVELGLWSLQLWDRWCSTTLFIIWSSRRDSQPHHRPAPDVVFCIHFSNGLFLSPPFTAKQGYSYHPYLQPW